ncbi:mechanosensitive ion channel family protein [Phocaeicola faecicola]|jgi:small-conductance mechanosensitive channel|nr:mechanosensitive ion channel family protein [Phocaeicola faecicola]MCI5742584.1 mechanosensitive ion channel family protein [Bacteroides sp.]MDY4871017.1 mechanosensitive ion channel family protein [Phocaeicola faecicola]
MKKFYLSFLFLLGLSVSGLSAQVVEKVLDILGKDSLPASAAAVTADSDSVSLAAVRQELAAAKLNEANLRMEIEQIKLAAYAADSLKLAGQKQRIDSLRQEVTGVPVVVEGDTLFYFYAKRGGHTPQQRAENVAADIAELGKLLNLQPDSVYVESSDIVTDVMYKGKVLVSFTDMDGLWENCTRDQLAADKRLVIMEKLHQMKESHGLLQLGKRIVYFILVLVGQYLLFRVTNWLFRKLKLRIVRLRNTRLKPFSIQDYELLDTLKQVKLLVFLASLVRYVIMFLQLLLTVPLLFSIFPQTKDLAYQLFSYIWNPVKSIFIGVVDYIPNLFTIFIIYMAVKYLVRLFRYLADEVQSEHLKLRGFYPDWAIPTYHIIRFLLYAFMLAMIYPYLPGSNSGVFQGISVFVGLIVSLGSSTVIGNIIAGLVITYMRPFKIGDCIKLNDTTGNVVEKTPLVTRIRTPKNEVVTIPNSFVMSSHTVNFSQSAREYGLIIHSEVSIGYDVPWRTVNKLLVEAALNTPGVVDDPRPFVLSTSLSDWYPVYQVNAYIKDADRLAEIYSDLHQNIQDRFNEAGVEIMSPHYMAVRDGNASTIPPKEGEEE